MRKIITIVSVLCAGLVASANPVTKDAAQAIAQKYFSESSVNFVWDGGAAATKAGDEIPPFYVFSGSDGSWVMIAGDDCAVPVLAHGDGAFDVNNIPDNMAFWLKGIRSNINTARSEGIEASSEVKAKWQALPRTPRKASSQTLLTTAAWSQETPYNNACPTYNSKKCVTGCVATAMSIVLRYNQWPEYGTGTIPAYTTDSNGISVAAKNIDGYEYDWSSMPLTNGSSVSWTSAQKTAVSDLMAHCGAMVRMDYDPDGSGAMSCDIVEALATHMSYSPSAVELYRCNYSNDEWLDMIRAEIDSNHPIIYGGSDTGGNGGHQFVCDGYNSFNEIHINWGWGGAFNAWYAVCYLGDTKSSGVDGVFSDWDSAIFGLRPAGTGSEDFTQELFLCADTDIAGIELASGTIAKGESFYLDAGYILNNDFYKAYDGAVKFVLVDKSGAVKQSISSEEAISIDPIDEEGYYDGLAIEDVECLISVDIALGDCIKLYYSTGDGSWKPVGYDQMMIEEDIPTVGALGAYDITMINVSQTLYDCQLYYPSLTFGHKAPASVTWYFDGSKVTKEYIKLTAGQHTLEADVIYSDSSTETIKKTLIVSQ